MKTRKKKLNQDSQFWGWSVNSGLLDKEHMLYTPDYDFQSIWTLQENAETKLF